MANQPDHLAHLPQVAEAGNALSLGVSQSRQQQGCQNPFHGHGHEQLEQREAAHRPIGISDDFITTAPQPFHGTRAADYWARHHWILFLRASASRSRPTTSPRSLPDHHGLPITFFQIFERSP